MIDMIGRFIRWLIRSIGGFTIVRLALLCLTLLTVAQGLLAVIAHILPDWLNATVIYAVLLGWVLGRSRLRGWVSALIMIGVGSLWLVLSVGQLSLPLDSLIQTLPVILKQVLFRVPVDAALLQAAWAAFLQNISGLANRISLWSHYVSTSLLIVDPGVTSLFWALVLWLVSGWSAWWLRRRESLAIALLPATAIVVYNVYYTNSKSGIVWLVLLAGGWIFLQSMGSYLKARRRWVEHQMSRTEIEVILIGSTILLASCLMLAGGLLPSVSIQKLSDKLQHIFQSQQNRNLAESLGLQQTPELIGHPESSGFGLSSIHAIGPGPQLSQQEMLYISVDGYVPPPPNVVAQHANLNEPEVRYYWRSQTFDSYNGHFWTANSSSSQQIAPDDPYRPGLTSIPTNFQVVRQHVVRLQTMDGALFFAGDLLDVDRNSIADWRNTGDLVDARTDSDSYTADSRLQNATVTQLEQAGSTYPNSILRYLALPDELPARVRDLAVRLTLDQPTQYRKVMAIQNYLRQFPYSLQVPGAPSNRDVADYFLFDLQKGYCDYFATTMVVLVRAVGIPARMVTGFSMGTYDYTTRRFVVVEANAHSWVEVYFPGLGWVEFEPTTNLPAIQRPGENASQASSGMSFPPLPPPPDTGGSPINWLTLKKPLMFVEFGLVGLAVLLIIWLFLPVESWLLLMLPVKRSLPAIQRRLYRAGRNWRVATRPTWTPNEFANAFTEKLAHFSRTRRLAPLVTTTLADVNWLTRLYTRLLFSQHPPTSDDRKQAVQNWVRIRKNLRKIRNS
jgi:transglutaminase-like putative cysteine protease